LIDTVLSLDDFVKVFRSEGGVPRDLRVCVKQESAGEHFIKMQVIVSAGIYNSVTGQPKKVLRCIVAQRTFNYHFLAADFETEAKKKYKEWVEQAYKQVEEKLRFKPIEGYWSWGDGTV